MPCFFRGCPALSHIAWPWFYHPVRQRPAAGALESANHIEHRIALASAEIPDIHAGLAHDRRQRLEMAPGKIDDMNVVAHAGAVAGRIAIPRSEEHTSELQSRENLVCRLLL